MLEKTAMLDPAPVPSAESSPAVPGRNRLRAYSLGEEIASAVVHGIGIALSVAGLTLLAFFAGVWGNGWHLGSAIAYGVSLVLLYTASTLYHSITNEKAKYVLKILDHSAIYLLIAGTYTPFTLVTLRASGGWWLFGVIWTLATVGVSLEAAWVFRPKWVSALIYIAMGWLVVVMAKPLFSSLPMPGVWLLVAGGLAYTLGTVFYVLKRVPYMHAVWHFFVLGGSVCHFLSIVLYVVPDMR